MTVYAVPCGISVLDGLTAKKDRGPADAKPGRLVKTAPDLGDGARARPDDEVIGWWVKEAADHANDARLTTWAPQVLSAETNTLAASSGLAWLRELLDRQDRVLLLASDTPRGVAAALYVAQHLAGTHLAGVIYLSTEEGLSDTPLRADLAPGTLTVARIRGLNPRHAQGGFIDAIASIGRVLRAAFDLGEALEVHLTGGFKATLLHTLAMTEVLYSLAPDRVSACYIFEDAAGPRPGATTIGLRRFPREYCDSMREELKAVRDEGQKHGARTFEGLAWTKDGLNAFGYGYLAVLGERLRPGRPGLTGA